MAVVAADESSQQAAAASDNARPPTEPTVDPQLLMAARRGDSKKLKELLRLKDEEEEDAHGHPTVAAAAPETVIVEVGPPPAAVRSASSLPAPAPLLDGVTIERDSLLHVVAACGDGEEFHRCARLIYHKHLVDARNDKGDTPLHFAAGAGNARMISCLIDLTAGEGETSANEFLRRQNNSGETALHLAIRAAAARGEKNKLACVDLLMAKDPELAAIPRDEEGASAASPLYLAISLGEMKIAERLFEKSEGKLSYSGPDGRNVLHAAVYCGQVVPMVLEWLIKKLKTADMRHVEGGQGDRHAMRSCSVEADDLLSRLASQRDNKNGITPLHLAASMGGLPSAIYVAILSPQVRARSEKRPSMTRLLLDANVSTTYLPNNQGMYPIHVAASAGCLESVKALLEICPDCATLRDAKGRTFLHSAAEKTRFCVVRYVVRSRKSGLSCILNMQDNNGDTALHRAVHAGDLGIVSVLIVCRQVRLDIPNKEGMTPIDVSWRTLPLKSYYAWDPRIHIRTSLLAVGAPYGENRGDLFDEKQTSVTPKFKGGEEKKSENLTSAAQVLALFSVLITTVTFASAFTLPGGYRSAGDGGGAAGTPVLAGSYAFDAFILADALAFLCSFLATSVLLYAGVPAYPLEIRFRNINCAYGLMMNSGRCLVAALALGLYVVLLPPVGRTIAIVIAVGMVMLAALALTKASEGILALVLGAPIARNRKLSPQERVLRWILFFLQRYWSFILIFGLPSICKWARAK